MSLRKPTTARQTLVEASGMPFAPSSDVLPVVTVIDGQRMNDKLESGDGEVAVYFELADRSYVL